MYADNNNIDWHEVIKKEAGGTNDADFGEVQLTMGNTVITEDRIIVLLVDLENAVH
jgi:hypothetical protein